MKAVVCFVMLAFGSVVTDMAGECDMAGFYFELGCTALPKIDNSTICPDAFECPDLHPDPTMCYYNEVTWKKFLSDKVFFGKESIEPKLGGDMSFYHGDAMATFRLHDDRGVSYKDRQSIPQALINNPCSQACSCQVSGGPRFECAAVDCVETFDLDLKQQCISTYDLESCCSTGSVCGTDAVAALKICEVDGKKYREGESFQPKNTRKTCICTGEWNGSTEGAYCRDINCGIEIHYQDMLADNCSPVFVGNMRSCPIAFQCPSPSSKIVRGLNRRGVNSQCTFGNMTLTVGDEVTVEETCMRCACEVPPFVACTKQNVCDN